jgi:hypothetical protein
VGVTGIFNIKDFIMKKSDLIKNRNSTTEQKYNDTIKFLSFIDWTTIKEHQNSDWIVVARIYKSKNTELFTFSALASMGSKGNNIRKILKNTDYDVHHTELGIPTYYMNSSDSITRFDSREKMAVNGIEFRPIVFYQSYHGYNNSGFELSQNFKIFFNAFFVPEQLEYQRINNDGDVKTIAKIIKNTYGQEIQVSISC